MLRYKFENSSREWSSKMDFENGLERKVSNITPTGIASTCKKKKMCSIDFLSFVDHFSEISPFHSECLDNLT